MGHGMCAALVPGVFRVDQESGMNQMGEFEVGDDRAAEARRGAAACPERAIAVTAAAAAVPAGAGE
jgi:ferredoxin